MNRSLWKNTLTKHWAPDYVCPHCKRGILKLDAKTMRFEETRASKRDRGDEAWDPTWIDYVFSCWLKCTDSKCGHFVAMGGKGGLEQAYDPEGGMEWLEEFRPHFALPMPDMIDVPTRCPKAVATELRAAFSLFWTDTSACANRIRCAIELLLDDIGVQRRRRQSKTFHKLTLHQRLEVFAQSEAAIGSNLLAVKWLGNTGSHGSELDRDELLDAFEIIEHSLAEIILKPTVRVSQLARKLTRKHGPRRKSS